MNGSLAQLPTPFRQRLSELIPAEDLAGCLLSFSQLKPTAFRVNTLRAGISETRAELEALGFELKPVSWYEGAFLVAPRERSALTHSAAFGEGRIYIQNLSSMAAPLALAPRPGDAVLDLAAAPGGKTLQLAAMMDNRGRLVAVDVVKSRYFKLKSNLDKGGATMVETVLMDGRAGGRRWPETFDKVLLDAPCSSEARFTRHNPQSWAHWSMRKVKESARKQRLLLQAAVRSLVPGGTLVYGTCSFSPEENELVVNSALFAFGAAIAVEPITLPFGNMRPGLTRWGNKELHPGLAHSARILPDAQMDGFYLCKLVKSSG